MSIIGNQMTQGNKTAKFGSKNSKFGGKGESTISNVYNKIYTFIFPNTKSTEEERYVFRL
jgi:hypothetical protein